MDNKFEGLALERVTSDTVDSDGNTPVVSNEDIELGIESTVQETTDIQLKTQQNLNEFRTSSNEPHIPQLKRSVASRSVFGVFKYGGFFMADHKLSDTLQLQYLFKWFFGIIAGVLSVIIEYGFVRITDYKWCDIAENNDVDKLEVGFLSLTSCWYSFLSVYQFVFCLFGWALWNISDVANIDSDVHSTKKARCITITVAVLTVSLPAFFVIPIVGISWNLFVTILYLIPIVSVSYYLSKIDGIRIWVLISVFLTILIIPYAITGYFIWSAIPEDAFPWIYPWFITLIETVCLKLITSIDVPKCCRKDDLDFDDNDDDEHKFEGAIALWDAPYVYILCGLINVFAESFRLAAIISVKDSPSALVITCITSILSEICTRNNLYYEFIYRYILRKPNPPLTRIYAIYLGCKLHTEYIPAFVVIIHNLLGYGYTNDCYWSKVQSSMNLSGGYWWIILLFLGLQIISDGTAHLTHKLLKKYGIVERGDKARKMQYVILSTTNIILATIAFTRFSTNGFLYDEIVQTSVNQ